MRDVRKSSGTRGDSSGDVRPTTSDSVPQSPLSRSGSVNPCRDSGQRSIVWVHVLKSPGVGVRRLSHRRTFSGVFHCSLLFPLISGNSVFRIFSPKNFVVIYFLNFFTLGSKDPEG